MSISNVSQVTLDLLVTSNLAKLFSARHITQEMPFQLSYLRSANFHSQWCKRWSNESTGHKYFKIQARPCLNHHNGFNRPEEVISSRIGMGHFPCRNYLHGFGLEEDPTSKLRGTEEEAIDLILLYCPVLA